jgi:hypothetical protein
VFLGLRDHVSAIHVRIHAPLEWRIDAYQRDNVVDRPPLSAPSSTTTT